MENALQVKPEDVREQSERQLKDRQQLNRTRSSSMQSQKTVQRRR